MRHLALTVHYSYFSPNVATSAEKHIFAAFNTNTTSKMKKSISAIASVVAVLLAAGCQTPTTTTVAVPTADSTALSIAYVNTDSLLLGYEYAIKMNDDLMRKVESSRADFNQKYTVFQQDAVEFQRKVNNNGFLSLERAQSEQQRLQKAEQDLQELNERLQNELAREQARLSQELHDTLSTFLKQYAEGRYSLILSNNLGDNVLYSIAALDITADVIEQLNARYTTSKK